MDRTYRHLLVLQAVLSGANSTASVFAMLFFLEHGGFNRQDVVLFNLISFGISAIGCVLFTRARPRHARALMAAGLGILAASYVSYFVLHGWPLLLFVAAAWGAYIPLFFLPFNALIIGITKPEDRAGKIGSFILTYTVVGIVGPTIGGALIDRFDYGTLFAVAAAILVLDVLLIVGLRLGAHEMAFAFDFRGIGRRTSAALFAEGGFEGMSVGVVPLIAYQFTQIEVDLGGLFSLFAAAGGVVTIILGVLSDRLRNRRPFLWVGAATSALASLLVVRAAGIGEFAAGQSLLSLTSSLAPLFLFTIAVERIPGRPEAAIVTREVLLNAGRATSLAAYFVLIAVGMTVQQAFILAAISLAFVALGDSRPRRS